MSRFTIIGLDFETSGTDPWHECYPIQLGIYIANTDEQKAFFVEPVFELNMYISWDWNLFKWDEDSEAVHGISKSSLQGHYNVKHTDIVAAASLIQSGLLGARMNNLIVGWNVGSFDRQIISRWFPALDSVLSRRTIDLNSLCFERSYAGGDKSFKKLKRRAKEYAEEKLSIYLPHYEGSWHDALYDAAAAVYSFEFLLTTE